LNGAGASPRDDLTAIYRAAVAAVEPGRLVRGHVERRGTRLAIRLGRERVLTRQARRVWVTGAGKGALAMARALGEIAPEVAGVVIAPRSSAGLRGTHFGRIRVLAGDHPVPGRRSYAATRLLLRELSRQPRQTTVLLLLSGGASALLAAPAAGVTEADKSALNRHLLRCGAPIATINAVRKHVSRVKGGGLVRLAAPREVVTLALSDVPGDDLATIGSGPGVPDPTTYAEALRSLRETAPDGRGVPDRVWRHLASGAAGRAPETLKPGERAARKALAVVVGSNATALRAAAAAARRLGYRVVRWRTPLAGEAAVVARRMVETLPRAAGPTCVLAGGETTVTVGEAAGRGGRSQELALAAAVGLAAGPWALLAAGSDGIDGRTDAAGAFCDGSTLERGGRRRAERALREHDAYRFFARTGQLFRPGPTGTNVMDLVIALRR
jgi:glycerate-2-kinase